MNRPEIERGLADWLRAWLASRAVPVAVREGTSAELLPSYEPYLLVSLSGDSEHDVGGLWVAEVQLSAISPALISGADPVEHSLLARKLEEAFAEHSFPGAAAAVALASGRLLQGWHRMTSGGGVEDGKWWAAVVYRFGFEELCCAATGAPGVDLEDLAAAIPEGYCGISRLVDARHGAVEVTIPAGEFQLAVAVLGDMEIEAQTVTAWINAVVDGPWPELVVSVPEGAVVVLSHGDGVLDVVPGPGGSGGSGPAARLEVLGEFEAGENLSGTRFVHLLANGSLVYADGTDGLGADGFVLSSALTGEIATVYREGPLPGLSGLTIGQELWLGLDGQWETVPTLAGRLLTQQLGTATSATTAAVQLEPPTLID